MIDVFISYPQRERDLMLPLKQRLEALGLILFVDVDGRLDGEATFPEALDKGVRAAKAVLGCWSPWALTRPWVQTECAIGKDQNKLVAVERVALSTDDVPALFYLVDRKPLADFTGEAPHEGWAMTLTALATKLRLWAEKNPNHTDVRNVRAKAGVLDKAALAERAGLAKTQPSPSLPVSTVSSAVVASASEQAWAAIDRSVEVSHYRRFENTFASDASAFVRVIEAEARAKAIERWHSTDKGDPDAIAKTMRTGLFPALQDAAQAALKVLEQTAEKAELRATDNLSRRQIETTGVKIDGRFADDLGPEPLLSAQSSLVSITRRAQLSMALSPLLVFVDDELSGALRTGKRRNISVSPGRHQLYFALNPMNDGRIAVSEPYSVSLATKARHDIEIEFETNWKGWARLQVWEKGKSDDRVKLSWVSGTKLPDLAGSGLEFEVEHHSQQLNSRALQREIDLALLELPLSSSVGEIRTAYRKLMMDLHPDVDRNWEKPEVAERLKAITEAFARLTA